MRAKLLMSIVAILVAGCSEAQPTIAPTQTQAVPVATATLAAPSTATRAPTTPASTPTRLPPTPSPIAQRPPFTLSVESLQSGFQRPVYLTHAGDGSGRSFVVEQAGRIHAITGKSPAALFLDITALVDSSANERGLLSVAFHPDYKSNGFLFVNYTRKPDGATVVSSDPNVADPSSATVILTIPQPEANHNGGLVQFGPDGYLYIGMGDGGGAGDRHGTMGNGQELASLLGKLLRIDVNGNPYSIPASNPFQARAGARPEIWAYGLRNPWRWSFDRRTGDLYIADVGQDKYEEIDLQPASSRGGENYGWRLMEGKHCYNPSSGCEQPGLTMPVAEYDHSQGCSVTGGYVYRGARYPWLDGLYFFADYCSGIVWSLDRNPAGAWEMVERARVSFQPSSFGQDQAGELYLVGLNDGTVYHLVSTAP
jgi:glucose/arabinose dehydrogenase